jgi:hypothetical protein|tara:strand:- start:351 stop:521 length:171 start_codon:yes stop_codon:yes gene_type:complete
MKKRYNFTLDKKVKQKLEEYSKDNYTTMSAVLTRLILSLDKKPTGTVKLPAKRIQS